MKNRIYIIVLCLFSTVATNAAKYCGDNYSFNVTISGQGKTFTCDLTLSYENSKYKVILADAKMGGKDFTFDNGMSSSGWTINTHTATQEFNTKPTTVSFYGTYPNSYGNTDYIWSHSPATITLPAAEWENACAPDDSEAPIFSSSLAATNIQNRQADIQVVATDNTGITQVVIKNGSTTLLTETITPTTSLNDTYTIKNLTKNTEYTLTVILSDAAGNTASQTVTFTTANLATTNFYFVNTPSWGAPHVHYWKNGGAAGTTWPGNQMDNTGLTNCDGYSIWNAEIESQYDRVNFNQGNNTNQIDNKAIVADQFYNNNLGYWLSPENLYMIGTLTDWECDRTSAKKFSSWDGISTYVTWKKKLPASTTYEFRVHYWDGTINYLRGNGGTITSSTTWDTWWEMGADQNCTIKTDIAGTYTFYYDFTASRLKVVYPAPRIGCEGETGNPSTGSGPHVKYTFTYTGGNIYVTASPTDNATFTSCKFEYCNNTSGSGTVTTNMTLSSDRKEAVCVIPATGTYTSGSTMYFRFTYRAGSMGSEGSSVSGWYDAPTYTVGNCALEDDEPYLTLAEVESQNAHSVTLHLAGNVNNGTYNVTQFVINGTLYTADGEGKVTITGLNANTEYDFLVYAYYNGNESSNSKIVTARTMKESECEGTRGHYAVTAETAKLDFRINYDYTAKNITMTFNDHDGGKLDFLQVEWNVPYISAGTSNNSGTMTSSAGVYTYVLPATDNMLGRAMGIQVIYSNETMAGNLQISDNNNPDTGNGVIYYIVGECGCVADDGDLPVMEEATIDSVTATSVTLNVAATDPSSTVKTFVVNDKDYLAIDGKITVTGLSACTSYNLQVYAKDPSCNVSGNYATVPVTTNETGINFALASWGTTAVFGYEGNADYKGEKTIDGSYATRGGSQKVGASNEEALANGILTLNFGQKRTLSEIVICWERACATDYELQASIDGTHWSTIRRYTERPRYAVDDTPVAQRPDSAVTYTFDPLVAQYIRVKPNMLNIASQWGLSIFEIEAYNNSDECHTEKACPSMLGVRTVERHAQSAVLSLSAIDTQTPDQAELTYRVVVTSLIGGRTVSNTYTFLPDDAKRTNLTETAAITLEGLVPGTYYSVEVWALDPENNLSCNSSATSFRTGKGEGCNNVYEGNDAIVEGDWKAFPGDMKYRLELSHNEESTQFTAVVSFINKPADMTISTVYLAIMKEANGDDCYAGWLESENALTNNGDGTWSRTFSQNETYERDGLDACSENTGQKYSKPRFPTWPKLDVYLKLETSYGIIHPNYFTYDISETSCEELFVIFHNDDAPAEDMQTSFAGGTIDEEIYYYRLLTPGQWEPLCLPFEVDRVSIFDSEDKAYYDLTPRRKSGGSFIEGDYWIRHQAENVSGAEFKASWYDGEETLPQKNTAYNLRLPNGIITLPDGTTEEYYQNKYLIFHGTAGQSVSGTFSLATAPSSNDQYILRGNTTMMPQAMAKAYKEDDDGAYYRMRENWTLQPFECYVLANTETMRVMRTIGPWRGGGTPTADEALSETVNYSLIRIYNLLGQEMFHLQNCSVFDAFEYAEQVLPQGCYLFVIPEAEKSQKMIVK